MKPAYSIILFFDLKKGTKVFKFDYTECGRTRKGVGIRFLWFGISLMKEIGEEE